MPSEPLIAGKTITCVRTLRLKVKTEAYSWLNAAAVEINQVWNYANEISARAARPFAGPPKWLSAYDLDKLTAGATECFERIGSDSIQRVNAEYATRRKQFKKVKLRWRVNAAINILSAWRCSTSVCGNESSPDDAPPSQAYRLREAGISARKAAA